MSQTNGVVIGLVTQINDNGTVKVKFPWLPDEPETDWIRIATTMAGSGRGTFFMPEQKDEVLVAFEHGVTNKPYVVGFLWNGKDKPPENSKNTRRIRTKSGHSIEFNDNLGQEKVVIESQGKQKVEINDMPTGSITVTTKMGNQIKIDDASGSISIKALSNISLTAVGEIKLSAASIALAAPNISLGAMASLGPSGFKVTAPSILLNGDTTVAGPSIKITGPTIIKGPSPPSPANPPLSGSMLTIS
jgi:phage baseplate assembly protein gpV